MPKVVTRGETGPAFLGCLAANREGTVGALWVQHERYEVNPRDYRIWFAASRDGGETFTSPVPVSSAVSRPNLAETTKIDHVRTRNRGGDYIGMAVTSDSVFHAVWADARDGLFHLFHSPLSVR